MSVSVVSGALALASAGCIGLSNVFGGLASRRTGAMSAVIWMEWVGVLPTLAVATVTTGSRSLVMVVYGMAIGVLAGAGLVCYYRALSVGAMAIAAPLVGAISSAIPAVIGLATGDHLRVVQLTGLMAAVIAIALVAFQPAGSAPKRGIALAVTAGLFDTLGFLLLLFAYRGGALSVTTVLASLYPAVAVLLGWVILHERLRRTQTIGVAMALVSVGLISAG